MESPRWYPLRWSPERVARFRKRVWACALIDMYAMLGTHEGNIVAAEIRATMQASKSRAELKARGIPTLGETST